MLLALNIYMMLKATSTCLNLVKTLLQKHNVFGTGIEHSICNLESKSRKLCTTFEIIDFYIL